MSNDKEVEVRPQAVWMQYALVAAVAVVVVFWRLDAETLDNHESFLAITARTMSQPIGKCSWLVHNDRTATIPPHTKLNHWMVPVENGRPRLVKTPLPYWLAAGIGMASGELTPFGARLTSAISAVLLSMITLALGRKMLPPRPALLGALVLATSVGFQIWGRDARPEMLLCLFITASMACFYMGLHARKRRWLWMCAFWVCMGLANLAKEFVPLLTAWGLVAYLCWRESNQANGDEKSLAMMRIFLILSGVGLVLHVLVTGYQPMNWWAALGVGSSAGVAATAAVMLGGPMLWCVIISRGYRPMLKMLPGALVGMIVMAAMFVPWMLYMADLFPDFAGEVFASQTTDRAAGVGKWSFSEPHLYIVAIFTLCLPWVGFVPGGFAAGMMRRFNAHRSSLMYLLLWSLGLLVLFSAAAGKRVHYIMPMLPAFSLLMGFVIDDVFFSHRWIRPVLGRLLGLTYGLAGPVALIVLGVLWKIKPDNALWPSMFATVAVACLFLVPCAWLSFKGRLKPAPWLIAASILVIYVGHWSTVHKFDDNAAVRDFAIDAAEVVGDDRIYHWGDPQAKTVYYFGRCVHSLIWRFENDRGESSTNLAIDWIKQDPSHAPWIIGYQDSLKLMDSMGYKPVISRPTPGKKKLVFTLYGRSVEQRQ